MAYMLTSAGLYLISGLILGFTAGVAPGPLSALLVARTMRHGVADGVKIALAPIITDLPIIGVSVWLMGNLAQNPWPLGLISLAGGGYLGYLAWSSITIEPSDPKDSPTSTEALKMGALVNLFNPHPYLFWLTVGAPLLIRLWNAQPWASAGWLLGFYIALVGAKIAMAVLVGQTRRWVAGSGYTWLNRIMGVLLAIFALVFIRDGLDLLGMVG